ncbi:MAG: hypothetical protein Q4C39_05470 [Clostridia bacterium]|nr:hypothetical protein [Clostridia bacterium]
MNVGTQEMYSEVYSILNLLGNSYITKLPKSLFKMIEEEKSSTYNPQYSEDQSLSEQNIKRESLSMIALFHLNYWCNSDEEKEQLKQLFKNNKEKHQAEIREKYNPDNLFKNNKQETIQEANVNSNNLAIVEYKESILKKFINKIKSLLHLG